MDSNGEQMDPRAGGPAEVARIAAMPVLWSRTLGGEKIDRYPDWLLPGDEAVVYADGRVRIHRGVLLDDAMINPPLARPADRGGAAEHDDPTRSGSTQTESGQAPGRERDVAGGARGYDYTKALFWLVYFTGAMTGTFLTGRLFFSPLNDVGFGLSLIGIVVVAVGGLVWPVTVPIALADIIFAAWIGTATIGG